MSSRPPFINWAEQSRADTGWKEAMWSLQHKSSEARATAGAPGRREDAAAQPGTPDELHHLHTADWPSRQEAAQQQQFGKAAGGSGEAGMPYGTAVSAGCCDGRSHCTANALQHGRRHQTDRGHSCSPQQDEQWAVSTGVPKWHSVNSHPACTAASPGTNAPPLKPGQQHSAGSTHRRLRHDTELSEVAVTLSRSTLRAVMRALAKGLADIQELRRTAEKAGASSDQVSSPLCDRSASPHQQRSDAQTPGREDSRCGQLSASRHGSAQQGNGLQDPQRSASSKGSGTVEHNSQKGGQRLSAPPMSHKMGSHLPHAQPTGHPMVRWRTSLRSSEPSNCTHVSSTQKAAKPHSAGGPSTPASQRHKHRDLPCSGKPSSTGVTQQAAAPQRCRALPNECKMAGESSAHGVAVQRARSCTGTPGSHQEETHQDHERASTAPLQSDVIAEQQDLLPPSSLQPCQQHLRQRYLPVYSVFDEKASASDGAEELLCAYLTRPCTPKPADAPKAAVEAAQQRQVGNKECLHAELASTYADEACKVQHPDVHNEHSPGSSKRIVSEVAGVQENILRAALQKFAMQVA